MKAVFLLSLLLLSGARMCLAQQTGLVDEWIQKDIEATRLIADLVKDRPTNAEAISKAIGSRAVNVPKELGFGAERIEESQGYGYTSIAVSAFVFNGKIINYRVSLGSSLSWSKIRKRIIEAWKGNVRVPFRESDDVIYFEEFDPQTLIDYKVAVSHELGEVRDIKVPASFKEDYEYLISPNYNSVVGTGGCGAGGVVPSGRDSIDALIRNNQIRLIENIVRGYNPGGRVYALIALLQMKRRGAQFDPSVEEALHKVANLSIKLETCIGGVVFRKTAAEILRDYQIQPL